MSRRLIILRHGQTAYNAAGRMQGQVDTELSELGVSQAARVGEFLGALPLRRIVSSDLRRAHDTAVAVGSVAGVQVTTDRRLRETQLGAWEGMTHAEVDAQWPGQRSWWRGEPRWAPPGGESRLEVANRTLPVVEELVHADAGWGDGTDTVMLVCHGGTAISLVAALLRLRVEDFHALGVLGNCRWGDLVQEELGGSVRWRLTGWNLGTD